jgi:hypothetical protein
MPRLTHRLWSHHEVCELTHGTGTDLLRQARTAGACPAYRGEGADAGAVDYPGGDLTQALAEADPEHKMEVHRALGLRLTYEPETQTVHASVDLGVHRWDPGRVRRSTWAYCWAPLRLSGTMILG